MPRACGAGPARRAAYRRLDGAGSSRRWWRAQCRDRRDCLGRTAAGAASDPPACWRGGPGARLTSRPPGPALCDFQARATRAVHEPPGPASPLEPGRPRGGPALEPAAPGERVRGRRDFIHGSPAQRAAPLGCMGGGSAPRGARRDGRRSGRPAASGWPAASAASSFEPPRRAVPERGNAAEPTEPAGASVPPAAVARPGPDRRVELRASPAGRAGRGERRRPRPPRGRTARRSGVPAASAAGEALAGIQPALPARHAREGEHRRTRPPRRSRPRYMRPAAALGWPDAGELGSNPSPRRSRPRPGGLTQASAARSRRPLVGR